MQIPNNRVFNLNSAITPEIRWGELNPSVDSGNATLVALPVGSVYVQTLGAPNVTSCIVWVKTLSDLVAAQNMKSAWTAISQTPVATGDTPPVFSSDEFMAYQPGMIYVQNETKGSGTYRTAWLKASPGGTRSNWISIAESQVLERVVASIKNDSLSALINRNVVLTWEHLYTGTPTVLEEYPPNIGIVGSNLRLTVPTNGLYNVFAYARIAANAIGDASMGVSVNGSSSVYFMDKTTTSAECFLSGSILIRLAKNDAIGVAVAVQATAGNYTLTNIRLSMLLVAP